MGHEKERSIRKMVRVVMSLYNEAKTRVRMGSAYLEEFKSKVGVH